MPEEKFTSSPRVQAHGIEKSDRRRSPLRTALCSGLLLGLAAASSASANTASTLVMATDGAFRGRLSITGAVREFLGIRYAQPATGELRWKPPQPLSRPLYTQDATQFGNHCPQPVTPFGNATLTEDCLFLNIFTPTPHADHDSDREEGRPVMVYIHGGTLITGESNELDATKLVSRGVVVVTINYRLGALGFLAHPALSGESADHISSNYGIEDQQAALKWVQRNIRAFGGNPEKVTLFGESAGGLSTFINMVSPTAKGLFHRAIVQSGAYFQNQPTLATAEAAGIKFANAVGCNQPTPAAVLTCLRALPVSTILAQQPLTYVFGPGIGPAPIVDGKVMKQPIGAALASGQFNRMPLMNGSTHDESNLFIALNFDLAGGPVNSANYVGVSGAFGNDPAAATLIASHYQVPAQFPSFDQAAGRVGTDASFACPARFVDELTSPFIPTFAYEFNDEKAPQNFLPPVSFPYGAPHASDIQYIFPFPNPSGQGLNLPQTPLTGDQQKLSDRMVGYWTQFAESGNPNGSGLPFWPHFHRTHQVMQSLVPPTPTTETNFATVHQCAFWDQLAGRTLPPAHDQSAENDN